MPKRGIKSKSQQPCDLGIEQPFEYDVEFCEGFICGNLAEVSKALAKFVKPSNIFSTNLKDKVPVRGLIYCLVQYQGENWVRIFAPLHHFTFFHEVLMALSKILKTKTIFWFFENTSCSYGYSFFICGKRVESIEVLPDMPYVFKSRLPKRASLKIRPGKEEVFIDRFFQEQEICVRRGFELEISKGLCVVKGPKLRANLSILILDDPSTNSL
jgi:hypothetical protein